MTFVAGSRLGPYEVLAPLGAGGMGEVYRARDSKLRRDVAIKVLPEALARDPDALARFEREALAVAALSHPNILSIFDFGTHDGLSYAVMELLEGETLRVKLASGPFAQRKAINYAAQIVRGLAAAHEKGIVHRDLKPENLFVTKEGHLKILDFGLARQIAQPADSSDTKSPTFSPSTEPGVVLGTIAYMSPEQVRGLPVDHRADIFAFGCVLYELLSGRRPFLGQSAVETMHAILREEPAPLPRAVRQSGAELERVIGTCLAKEPAERWQSAADLARELSWLDDTQRQRVIAPVRRRVFVRSLLPMLAGMIIFAIGFSVARWASTDHPLSRVPASFSVMLPSGAQPAAGLSPTIAISPDGTHLAYVVADAGRTQLYVRAMDQVDGTAIPSTDGADGVFFSPDSRWVGFFADHKLKKIAIAGGAAVSLCDAGAPLGASWGPDDMIVFASVPDAGFSRVSATGGVPKVLKTPDFAKGENNYFWPEILPGGKAVLFTALSSSGKSRIAVWNLETGEARTLVDEGMNARYGGGYLVFARPGALFAAPFDVQRLQVTGATVPVLDAVAPTTLGAAQFSLSRDGNLVYVSGAYPDIDRTLVWVNRAGAVQVLPAPPRPFQDPRVSPDGRRLLVEIYLGTKGDLWAYEFDRGTLSRVTFEGFENETPVWMPDSARVAFSSSRAGVQRALFWKAIAESGGDKQLVAGDHHMHLSSASADGHFLALTEYDPVTQGDIWVLPLSGTHQAQPFLRTSFHEWGAVFSPDTHWLAYVSNESGRDEIYIQAFPGPGQKHQISAEGGREPVWPPKGRELFYRNGRKMMAVSITTEPTFILGKPHELFEGAFESGLPLGHTNYDASPDGQRFVMIQARQQAFAARRVNVRLDWLQELQHRVPAGQ